LTLIGGFIALTLGLQAQAFVAVRAQPWYGTPASLEPGGKEPPPDPDGLNSAVPETTSVFLMAAPQYIACALVFSMLGHPWKQAVTRNKPFCAWLGVVALTTVLLFLKPDDVANAFLSLYPTPYAWNLQLLGWSVLSFVSYFAYCGLLYGMRRAGWFSARLWSLRACRRGEAGEVNGGGEKTHKRLRRAWAAQFGEAVGRRWPWARRAGSDDWERSADGLNSRHVSGGGTASGRSGGDASAALVASVADGGEVDMGTIGVAVSADDGLQPAGHAVQ
jgi:hypothetical protein